MADNDRWDVLIRNAEVYDGSGSAPFAADVALRGERIVRVGRLAGTGGVTIDASGLALAPGFIDVHSHDDVAVFHHPEMAFKVMQGVTTDVVGNCGLGDDSSRNCSGFGRIRNQLDYQAPRAFQASVGIRF